MPKSSPASCTGAAFFDVFTGNFNNSFEIFRSKNAYFVCETSITVIIGKIRAP